MQLAPNSLTPATIELLIQIGCNVYAHTRPISLFLYLFGLIVDHVEAILYLIELAQFKLKRFGMLCWGLQSARDRYLMQQHESVRGKESQLGGQPQKTRAT